jgi:ribosomal-protein-alanine N-acetyltransferase
VDQPEFFLRSARLGFRWWTPDDLHLATLLWGDPAVTQYLGGPYTPAQIAERLERHLRFAREGGVQYWPLFHLDTGDFVGCCGLRPPEDGVYEAGLHLRPQYWRGGYSAEAALRVFQHAFVELGAEALTAEVHPEHGISHKLLARLGFVRGDVKMHPPTGILHMVYRLDRSVYEARVS